MGVALEEGVWMMSEEGENGQVGTREVSMEGLVAERCQLSEGEEMGLSDNRREMNKRTCLKAGRVLKCDSVRGSRVGDGDMTSVGVSWVPAPYSQQKVHGAWPQTPVSSDPGSTSKLFTE